MKNLTAPEVSSYAGAVTSIGASLTLTDWGVLIGIATALMTFALNAIYAYRKDRREQRESDARMQGK
ncbi:phage holin family protein [Massilia agilis]|uniref:Phage holin family protein n=1 Tax=Massilia agilis TaxID=1811226 RepID=A0ABT2DBJ6_9BURK|nr:phage holin family protein [Massilia agilis]MCS0808696.1 phage holin family protein [Massilia agilis]